MMVTNVRGHFKNVKDTLEFDAATPEHAAMQAVIDTATLWTGEPARDAHLKTRAGFVATGHLHRRDFGVSWNSTLDHGIVVGDDVELTLDAEAILEADGDAETTVPTPLSKPQGSP